MMIVLAQGKHGKHYTTDAVGTQENIKEIESPQKYGLWLWSCRKYGNNNDNNFQSKTDKNGCLCVWHSKTATLKHNPDISVIHNKEEISNFL